MNHKKIDTCKEGPDPVLPVTAVELAVCTVLAAFAASLLELSLDVAERKLLHKTFILSEADFCLTSKRKGQPKKKIS